MIFEVGDSVVIKAGTSRGMGKFAVDTLAIVDAIFKDNAGISFYRVAYLDRKGKKRFTHVSEKELR